MGHPDLGKTESDLDANVIAALCYAPVWIGVVAAFYFLATERANSFIRFHAIQSIALGAAALVAWFLLFVIFVALGSPIILLPFGAAVWLAFIGAWLWALLQAYLGSTDPLPIVGELAAEYADKLGPS